jgi:ABC-2 type transport system ATP-binding protein
MSAVVARAVHVAYGDRPALAGVDLVAGPGEVVALLGPNGAGKSSLLSVLCALRRPQQGTVRICGTDAVADPEGARAHVGFVPQVTGLYAHATVAEHVALFAALAGVRRTAATRRAAEVIDALGLTPVRDRRAARLSGGQRRRLLLALAFVGSPSVLLLDEPGVGVDADASAALHELIRQAAGDGTAVLCSTHQCEAVERLADTVTVLVGGRVRFSGPLPALVSDHGRGQVEVVVEGPAPAHVVAATGATVADRDDGRTALRWQDDDPGGGAAAALAAYPELSAALRYVEVLRPSLESAYTAVVRSPHAVRLEA